MLFTTDQQTLNDLNIFAKRGADSIFTLFNRAVTAKGAEVLEDMFRYPLTGAHAINRRSELIAAFPFRPEWFDAAELYLSDHDERTRLVSGKRSLGNKLNNLVGTDAAYQLISDGVTALTHIIHAANAISTNEVKKGGDLPLNPDVEEIDNLLSLEPFATVLRQSQNEKTTRDQLAVLDTFLRFQHRTQLHRLLHSLYRLDAHLAVATVAREHRFAFPKALAGGSSSTIIEGFYHPLLKGAVPNDLTMSKEHNIIFLTGANMAGKSTFMKSMGIAMYLAHMGFPVPAKTMEFAVMDSVFTTINLSDDLGIGASHFYAEVLRIKKIAKEISMNKKVFVIFDELFRGTNVMDAYEATVALTAAFGKRNDCLFVISTHIVEAGERLKTECATISFKYLPTTMNGTKPVYSYKLQNGITADRHGMVIINNEGILELLKNGKKNDEL
jgi:DNA mismatch repair protein MutS